MKEETENSFFKKLIISIKDFEKYPELASKKWGVVLPYLVKLLVIFTIVVSFCSVYKVAKEMQKGLQYINNEIPDFTFENNKLIFDTESSVIKENENSLFNTIIMDTQEIEEETINKYKENLQKVGNGIVLLQDKALVKTTLTNGIVEYSYDEIAKQYQIQNFNKQELLEYFSGTNILLIYIGIFIMVSIYLFLVYFTSIWLDIILLAAFGHITALLMRLHLRFSAMCKIAIHSLTLPILLNIIVILLETFTSFKIKYFEFMYIGIAYIYIITAILMIKSDVIKNQQELAKIIEEQARVKAEMERKKEEEEEQKEEERRKKEEKRKKEKKEQEEKNGGSIGEEPQGENA